MFRLGRVTAIDETTCRVRVAFGAHDALVSYWLPVMQQRTAIDQLYALPGLDEHVVCLLDQRAEFGVVLGALYNAVDTPPIASKDRVHMRFGDGTAIDYDRAAHALTITACAGGSVTVIADHVHLGGAGGDQLVTKSWIDQVYATHVHGTSIGPTIAPVGGGQAIAPHVTEKVLAS